MPASLPVDTDVELKRLAATFDLDDTLALGQALGLEDETIRNLQEKPGSSTMTVVESVMRTWVKQHTEEGEEDERGTLNVLKTKLTSFRLQAKDEIKASSDKTKDSQEQPAIGPKRWAILVGLFFVSFIEVGSIRTLSLILDDLTYQFDVSTSYLAAIYGIVSGLYAILAFLNTHLLRRFSVRQLTMIGGAVSSSGLIFASFTETVPQVTAALIAFGAGYIFIILPTYTCLNSYFSDRFEIATGIMTSGGSTGVIIMPWLMEILLNMYGWRGAILLLGAFNAHFIVIGALLQPVRTKPARTKRKASESRATKDDELSGLDNVTFKADSTDIKESGSTTMQKGQELEMICGKYEGAVQRNQNHATENDDTSDVATITTEKPCPGDEVETKNIDCLWNWLNKIIKVSGLRIFSERPLMIVVCLQILLFSLPYATWLLFTIPNAQAKGLTDLRSAQISLAGGIANFLGRFASGFVFSKNVLPVEVWYLLANIVTATAFFVNFFADPFWFLTILSVIFGFMMGFNIPTIFVLVKNTAGKERYQTGLALLHLFYGIAFPLAGFVAGKIYDGTQSYNVAFCIMGGLALAAGVAVILPLLGSRFGKILKKCACSCV